MFNSNAFYIENPYTSDAAWRLDLIALEPVAIGTIEPPVFQNDCGIAIGDHAGYWDQGDCAVAIGRSPLPPTPLSRPPRGILR